MKPTQHVLRYCFSDAGIPECPRQVSQGACRPAYLNVLQLQTNEWIMEHMYKVIQSLWLFV